MMHAHRLSPRPLALLIAAAFASPLLAAGPAPGALPTGGRVTAGVASITQTGARMDVTQTTARAILEWQRFDIGSAARVNFAQPTASSIALNRVLAGDASQIMGRLTANGQVWLVNPAGVVFGAGSRVDVGGLVASALDIGDSDFLAGRNVFNRNGASGRVVNRGTLTAADGGLVALLAPEARNEGVISARMGNVVLAAGERVTLEAGANGRLHMAVDPATVATLVENRHLIVADGGQVVMSAQAADRLHGAVVANSGTVQARSLENRAGRILLLADMDHGEVRVGGRLDAYAPDGGDGAMGGFVETSGARVNVADAARVVTLAANGHHGTWLIDPNDYTIAASGGNISGATLAANLAGGNVTIGTATQGTAGGNGDIFVNDAVSWSANTTLSLQAQRDIDINADITATGNTAGLILGHGSGRDYALGNGARVTLSGSNPLLKIGVGGAEDTYIVINRLGVAGDTSTTTLQGMKNNLAGKYALGSDIDASATAGWSGGSGFVPVGSCSRFADCGAQSFSGVFTGMGQQVVGLTIVNPASDYVGLFGASLGTIRNVSILDATVRGGQATGLLAGAIGAAAGSVKNSVTTGNVQGDYAAGGLAGVNNGSISNSRSTAHVSATQVAGGLVGTNAGAISGSYASGSAASVAEAGGLVGENQAAGAIANSYSTALVGGGRAGGLAASNRGAVGNSYWDTATSGQATSDGGSGLTTVQMQQQASFPGWDFTNTWRIYEGQSTPVLRAFQTNLTVAASNATKTYDGVAFSGGDGVAYSIPGATPAGALAYGGSAQGAVNAGSYAISPTGLLSDQRYHIGFVDGTLTVNRAPLTVTANAAAKTYDGLADGGGNGVAYTGFVAGETATALGGTLTYGGDSQGAINAGSYAMTPAGLTSGNYTLSYGDGAATVHPVPLTITTANAATRTYDVLVASLDQTSAAPTISVAAHSPAVRPPLTAASPPLPVRTGGKQPDGGALGRELRREFNAPQLRLPEPARGAATPLAALPHLDVRADFIVLPEAR